MSRERGEMNGVRNIARRHNLSIESTDGSAVRRVYARTRSVEEKKLTDDYQKQVAGIPRANAAPQVDLQRVESIVEQIYLHVGHKSVFHAIGPVNSASRQVGGNAQTTDVAQTGRGRR